MCPYEYETYKNTKTWNEEFNKCEKDINNININNNNYYIQENAVFVLDNRAVQGNSHFNFSAMGGIKEIGDFCFKNYSSASLKELVLPCGLTKLGFGAFENATTLTAVHLNKSITKLPYKCFAGDINLKEIISPFATIEVEDGALCMCERLVSHPKFMYAKYVAYEDNCTSKFCKIQNVTIPTSVNKIKNRCFKQLTSLECVKVMNATCFIGKLCFVGCSNIKSICLDKSVVFDKHLVFANLSSLTAIALPTTLTKVRNFMFKNCVKLEDVTMQDQIVKIGDSAFQNCKCLKTANIPHNVIKIGYSCFKGCSSLKEIYCTSSLHFPVSSLYGVDAIIKIN
ncbi:hypothetical protein EIN_078520 [Entamoeba invadens IP1]|uniref:Leucine rich repeat containing protein BspA family protein n=1 Tax=Entamoeba invadens IP1 TaxID=370355 RepID=A0A0A1TYK7_ENTIV|nr:hypothetical protein EIN_078520 [Entamoeba invadens IP1]ELP83597.1 hypothetical protein EIN_078520 [Entamoeba invadens IP1]|eukprot:XP_004182943.1 hypothetical protein EIN_078520 [Entamoeba invadens IP1]